MAFYLFFPVFVLFSFSPNFSSKISLQPFKIETSNLVYRFTTTSCDVGLKMDILLFVLPCIFLPLKQTEQGPGSQKKKKKKKKKLLQLHVNTTRTASR